jgi:hypothetical protein
MLCVAGEGRFLVVNRPALHDLAVWNLEDCSEVHVMHDDGFVDMVKTSSGTTAEVRRALTRANWIES